MEKKYEGLRETGDKKGQIKDVQPLILFFLYVNKNKIKIRPKI
jgi:hypothetical protein